jgi:hypothetical protein
VAYSRLVKKNITPFFGKAKVMEIVKCKNFEKEIIRRDGNEKRAVTGPCLCCLLFF